MIMGGSCSLQRQRSFWSSDGQQPGSKCGGDGSGSTNRRAARHSIDSPIPDESIANLYPSRNNYVLVEGSRRSPKSLFELCIDSLCRSLPDLDGELPPGLPQDIVDAIAKSLIRHSALNATTLRALKNCEIGTLSLAGCRGVGDEWFSPLLTRSSAFTSSTATYSVTATKGKASEAFRQVLAPSEYPGDAMDTTDPCHHPSVYHPDVTAIADAKRANDDASCSTASYHSASSRLIVRTPTPTTDMTTGRSPTNMDEKVKDGYCFSPIPEDSKPSPIPKPYYSTSKTTIIAAQLKVLDLRGSQRLTDRGLLQLGELSSVEVVKLDGCHSLVGKGLIVFSSANYLHTLSLANCRRLTDEAVINISHLTSLTALILDGCRCLTDRSLEAVSNLFRLQKLDLTQCDLMSNEGLGYLHCLVDIEELSLGWCRSINDKGIEILSSQPSRSEMLRVLRIARCPITDQGVLSLAKLTSLEALDINGCSRVSSTALGAAVGTLSKLESLDASFCPNILRASWQGKINKLKSLELCYSGVRDHHLSHLTNLPNLEELNLDSCPVGDWAIAHLADNNVMPNLARLDLADTDLTDLGMVHLPKFTKMARLSLFYCNITNAGLRHLASMPALEVLNLDSRSIGDNGLAYLKGLKNLKSLDVFSGLITDAGCAHLCQIKSLQSLELCGGGVGDLGCAFLASLDNLTSLNLSQNDRISNRGAASLATLTNLKALNLSNTRVTSAALTFLGGLVKLQSLAMYGCRGVSDGDGLDALQLELPSLRCLRLNRVSDNDGVVETSSSDDGEGEEDEGDGDDRMLLEESDTTFFFEEHNGESEEESHLDGISEEDNIEMDTDEDEEM